MKKPHRFQQIWRQSQELYNLEIARLLAGSAEYNGQTGGAFHQRRQKLVSENRRRLDPAETMPPSKSNFELERLE